MTKRCTLGHARVIKIGRTCFPVLPAQSNNFTGLRAIPWIRLRGVWLEQAGFSIGQSLEVEVRPKLIIISTT